MNKVVLLAPTPPPEGGIAGWTVRMLKAELKNDWSIVLVDEKSRGNREIFSEKNNRKLSVEIKRCLRIWGDLWRALRDPDAKIIHSCIPSYTLSMLREYVCACLTKLRGRKFIIHFRCTVPNSTRGSLGLFLLKRLCNISDCIFSLNQQTSDFLCGMTRTPISLIPNFINEEEVVEEHSISNHVRRVLYVGGLVEDKGVGDLLRVAEKMPDVQFVLVGRGESSYVEYAKSRSSNNVIFAGSMDRQQVREELKKADVFLFLSYFRGEGFSNALCEAMAAGVPCVATDWAANKDMIEDAGGKVVKVHDVGAVVNALREIDIPEQRKQISQKMIQKVKQCYTERIVIDRYIDEYESLLLRKEKENVCCD